MMIAMSFLAAALSASVAASAIADTIHVPGDFPTIQEAVDAANAGDTILVAPGVYEEAIVVESKAITLRSEEGPEVTTLESAGSGTNTLRCIGIDRGQFMIEGFTLDGSPHSHSTRGLLSEQSDVLVINCVFREYRYNSQGGSGIFALGGTLTVKDSSFYENTAISNLASGAIRTHNSSQLQVLNCTFEMNKAVRGAAIHTLNTTSVIVRDSTFDSNVASNQWTGNSVGGAILAESYFLYEQPDAHVIIDSCTFINNSAEDSPNAAGAVGIVGYRLENEVTVTISKSSFIGNSAISGGAMLLWGSPEVGGTEVLRTVIEECEFIDNTCLSSGSAILMLQNDQVLTLNDVLIQDNVAGNSGAIASVWSMRAVELNVYNSRFIRNSGQKLSSAIALHAWDPESGLALNIADTSFEGNLAEENGFVLRIPELFTTAIADSTFCANDPQIISGEWTDGGGNLFGAYCPIGDLTGDGNVNGADLGQLLAAWGPCLDCEEPTADCPPDFNADCIVDGADLAILLGNWG